MLDLGSSCKIGEIPIYCYSYFAYFGVNFVRSA